MPNRRKPTGQEPAGEFDRGFEGHSRRQVKLGLRLSPAERLEWLERAMDELRGLLGRARKGRPNRPKTD